MKCRRFLIAIPLMAWLMGGVFAGGSAEASSTDCAHTTPAAGSQTAVADGLVKVALELQAATREQGVELRVLFENSGAEGFSLAVCPTMLLCCVKGLHPLISCGDTGVGLLDVCTTTNPTNHEVFLPANSTFSFNIRIPPERLPEVCLQSGQSLSVHVRYEADDQHPIESNVVTFTLK